MTRDETHRRVVIAPGVVVQGTTNLEVMREILIPPLRAGAIVAFITGLVLMLTNPPSLGGMGELLTVLVVAVGIVLVTAWVTVLAIGK
jgi:hypothetical protein